MAYTFGFFSDPALTTRISQRLAFVQADAMPVPDDKIVWFGSPNATVICKAAASPGVTPIMVAVDDAGGSSGSPAANVKLALSSASLATATGGAALALPAVINGGQIGAIAIHIRVTDSTHVPGVNNDLSLLTNPLVQS